MHDLTRSFFTDYSVARCPSASGPLVDAPLQQSTLWARAADMLGARIEALPPHTGGGVVLHRHFPLLGEVALISRGPAEPLDVAKARRLRHDLACKHLVIHAENSDAAKVLERAGYRRIARPRRIAELSLIPGTSALAEGLSGKWRNRLRHAGQQPLHVTHRPFAPDLEHWLLRKEGEQARARGYRPLPARMVCALAAADPGAAQLFTAHLYGQRVAAKLFLRHGNRATYQIGWSTPEGRARSAGTLLMWRAMLALRGMGVTQIDLGAADPATAPGLARFKQGTGATLRDLGGSWLDTRALPRRAVQSEAA